MAGFLADLSGPRAVQALGPDSIVLVPVGAVEQHGPHLPLSVDFVIADEATRSVMERLGDELDLWALPCLPFSKSNEHAWSDGTIWLSSDTLQRVIADIGRCVAQAGVRRIVFLNGHGGNTTLLNVALRELRLVHRLLTFLVHPFVPPAYLPAPEPRHDGLDGHRPDEYSPDEYRPDEYRPDEYRPDEYRPDEQSMGIHGGYDETAVMLHLRPDLVDLSLAERNVPEWLARNEHVRFGGTVQFGWTSEDFGSSGLIGDPTTATAEVGAQLFETAVGLLCDQLREIAVFDFPDTAT